MHEERRRRDRSAHHLAALVLLIFRDLARQPRGASVAVFHDLANVLTEAETALAVIHIRLIIGLLRDHDVRVLLRVSLDRPGDDLAHHLVKRPSSTGDGLRMRDVTGRASCCWR
jgi:hypothetical protein